MYLQFLQPQFIVTTFCVIMRRAIVNSSEGEICILDIQDADSLISKSVATDVVYLINSNTKIRQI